MTDLAETAADAPDLTIPTLYLDRELSWLAFNQRVLDQASDPSHPLLERVKFLAIAANNLDEFFMVRLAVLERQRQSGVPSVSPTGRSPAEQLALVRPRAVAMLAAFHRCWEKELRPQLAREGVTFLESEELSPAIRDHLAQYFTSHISPVLTPLGFDPGHPFPYISNRSKSFALVVQHDGRTKFARVKVPDSLPRFVPIPPDVAGRDGVTFAFLEDVIRLSLFELFPDVPISSAHLFRVLRDSDLVVQEDGIENLLESVDRGLQEVRHGALSLLELDGTMPDRVLDVLIDNFEAAPEVVTPTSARLGFADWMALMRLPRPDLKDPPFTPRVRWGLDDTDLLLEEVKYADVLVHHPFDSFASVEAFLTAAVRDPLVVAVKMTLYRIGPNSPLVDLLINAAREGKQVAVLVELKARFDERSNIAWAARLEEAGVHVVYGVLNLKTHCKLCLIVRQTPDGIQRYAHVATGNYNRATAHVYTDVGLFTANPDVVADVSELFNYLTGYSHQTRYRVLHIAPVALRDGLLALVEREIGHARAGRPAQLVFKCNGLSDPDMIRALYRASMAGVRIELIVRGICCLRPGVPGVSDHIRVRSVIGRFLEHSRLFSFLNGGSPEMFFGSADLMERNFDRRIETLCPVVDAAIRTHLNEVVLSAYLQDNTRAFALQPDGTYRKVEPGPGSPPVDAQQLLLGWTSRDASSELR